MPQPIPCIEFITARSAPNDYAEKLWHIRIYTEPLPNHKAALLLDTESGSRYTTMEPGLPGPGQEGGKRRAYPPQCGRSFLFSFKLRRSLGIILRVGGERKEYGAVIAGLWRVENLAAKRYIEIRLKDVYNIRGRRIDGEQADHQTGCRTNGLLGGTLTEAGTECMGADCARRPGWSFSPNGEERWLKYRFALISVL
jgi:hypothetical protein